MSDRTVTEMTTEELISALGEAVSYQGELKAQEGPIRAELLKRQLVTGETALAFAGWQTQLTREPFTLPWLQRQLGYTEEDLPPECFTEKVTRVVDWHEVAAWLAARDQELPTSYILKFQRQKKAA